MAAWPDSRRRAALVELGVTDVVVLERATVGSGGTGKSSGIVRCHYGIPSLAAMAWRALPVLERAGEILGAPSGYTDTGYLVGVGPENLGALRANVAMQQALGIEVELVGHDEARAPLAGGPARGLRRVRLRAPRRLRRRAPDRAGLRRRGTTGRGAVAPAPRRGRHRDGAATRWPGVRLSDGGRIGAAHVVAGGRARGPPPWPPPLGLDLPIRAQRAQILLVDPGRAARAAPGLLGPGLAAVRAHRGHRRAPARRQRPLRPGVVRPRRLPRTGRRRRPGRPRCRSSTHRFPGLDGAALVVVLRRLLRRDARLQPGHLGHPVEGLWLCAGFSGHGYKISPAGR